ATRNNSSRWPSEWQQLHSESRGTACRALGTPPPTSRPTRNNSSPEAERRAPQRAVANNRFFHGSIGASGSKADRIIADTSRIRDAESLRCWYSIRSLFARVDEVPLEPRGT